MGDALNSLFGKKPKKPILITQPAEKIQQDSTLEKDKILKEFAKRRKATMLNQVTGPANIKKQKLGAM